MLIVLNTLMAIVSVVGMAWYKFSYSELWPMLGYFITLFIVGTVSVTAHYVQSRSFRLWVAGINGVSAVLLVAILIAAFVLSPGSGVAAFPFLVVPFAINVASLNWVRAEIKG